MQVADGFEVFSMLDGDALERAVRKHSPDIIVPEGGEYSYGQVVRIRRGGIQVTPSAKAANFTMNRKLIRDLAAKDLGLRTAPYAYATNIEEFESAVEEIGVPCVVKPLMSSSGKGQSVVKDASELEAAFNYAMEGSRGDLKEIIVEGFIDFHTEITLLTVTQKEGETLFCAPIGHRQERGDYKKAGNLVLWMMHSLRKLRIWREKLHRPSVEQVSGVLNFSWVMTPFTSRIESAPARYRNGDTRWHTEFQ